MTNTLQEFHIEAWNRQPQSHIPTVSVMVRDSLRRFPSLLCLCPPMEILSPRKTQRFFRDHGITHIIKLFTCGELTADRSYNQISRLVFESLCAPPNQFSK